MPKRPDAMDIKHFDYFAEDDMKHLKLPKKLAAACRKDRLAHRRISKRERLFEPGAIKRFKFELQDELVDFINYCINIRFLRVHHRQRVNGKGDVDEKLFHMSQHVRDIWTLIERIKRKIT